MNLPVVCPAGTKAFTGTVATVALELARLTTTPVVGAAAEIVTVPVQVVSPILNETGRRVPCSIRTPAMSRRSLSIPTFASSWIGV